MLKAETATLLEALHPDTTAALCNMVALAPETTDSQLLALCLGYVDAALHLQDWAPPRPLTAKEQAFIAFTEQFVASVGTMSDTQVARLQEFASADEVYAFVNALYVTEMARRLELVARKVLP